MQKTEVQEYLKRLPGDAPLRFETVFPLQHPENLDRDALGWNTICNGKVTLLALADMKGILGYRSESISFLRNVNGNYCETALEVLRYFFIAPI